MNFPATPSGPFHFPTNFNGDAQIFHAHNSSSINFQPWIKPRGTSMTYIVAIGGGGGGGGGHQKPADTNGGGGGGGGSGGIATLLVPSFLLPDILYVQVGLGGRGGNVSTAGGVGTTSHILLSPRSYLAQNALISSEGSPAGGGGAGLVGGAGAGGAGGGAGAIPVPGLIGITNSVVGQAGGAGGGIAGANGTSVTVWNLQPISSGAGGAGIVGGFVVPDFSGGNITAASAIKFQYIDFPTTAGAVALGGANIGSPRNGGHGVNFLSAPFLQSGGAGGGSNANDVAGYGGNGGIGCGGGGGGAGLTGGRGGNGGNGLVAIFSW